MGIKEHDHLCTQLFLLLLFGFYFFNCFSALLTLFFVCFLFFIIFITVTIIFMKDAPDRWRLVRAHGTAVGLASSSSS